MVYMPDKKIKTKERKEKTSTTKIADFLTDSGFILEMEISEFLKKKGYKVDVNRYFFDYDENKKREIDIIASKIINDIKIILLIECKQSTSLDWIFVCSDKSPSRYYDYIKYFPKVPYGQEVRKTKVFNHLRQLDHKIPLAQNSTIRHVSGDKNNSKDIYECIMKLPKEVVGLVEEIGFSKDKRTIIIPLAVFSGQIFTAEYKNKLTVKEVKSVQYSNELDTDNYTYHYNNRLQPINLLYNEDRSDDDKKNSPVAKISNDLGKYYLIEFVTKKGLQSFLSDTEDRISKIDLKLWPIEEKSKE